MDAGDMLINWEGDEEHAPSRYEVESIGSNENNAVKVTIEEDW